jgi:TnpA family transposase
MRASNKRLTILSELDQCALYDQPDFDDNQRAEFLTFTDAELALIKNRPDVAAQIYCAIQLGYFKTKHFFFRLSWEEIDEENIAFVIQNYFLNQPINKNHITKHEYYYQRTAIASLFNYNLWTKDYESLLEKEVVQIAQRDNTPRFIALELFTFLREQKIVRPGYTTLQTIISSVLTAERQRLKDVITAALDEKEKSNFKKLLQHDNSLSELAALKQDAKNFKFNMMTLERRKQETLRPFYQLAQKLLPKLNISKQNIFYYASLANYYTIYELRNLPSWQTQLYILCYAWQRYQQLNDNLISAVGYHLTQFSKATKEEAKVMFLKISQKQKSKLIGKLLFVFVDDTLDDSTKFGEIRKQAFSIMPKEEINHTVQQLCTKQNTQLSLRWQAIDKCSKRFKKHLRPLFITLDFTNTNTTHNHWLKALDWFKQVFPSQQTLSRRPLSECPEGTIPPRLKPYLYKKENSLDADRYEIWIYQQLYKRFYHGALCINDSLHYKNFKEELVSEKDKETIIKQLNIPWFQTPITQQLDALFAELHEQWTSFNTALRQGKLKHLDFDEKNQLLTCRKPTVNDDEVLKVRFYSKVPSRDLIDVLSFIDEKCHFFSALTPLQPRNAKQVTKKENQMAVLIAQATNRSNAKMAEICDISYHELETTYEQCFRLATLKAANDLISNKIAQLPIFSDYSLDLIDLYSAVDGQKYATHRPTTKARYSKKYFGKGLGVVAYTHLCNNIPLQTDMIGAHDPESYFVFDIYYNNTSEISPTVITGDMHALNKINFALMYCFGPRLEIRFTDLQAQLKNLYSGYECSQYQNYLIKPVDQIDRQLIIDEKENIDTIIATLGQKGITQRDLVRKMCTHTQNSTFKAIFELDKVIRSIYTLRYLQDPQLERKVHHSQNRIESYHQLRAVIAEVGGEKELSGRRDLAIEISNQCGRLIANAIVYYNSIILSLLKKKYKTEVDKKALALLKKISPIAWRHIHFDGHYTFCNDKNPIDLETIIAALVLE